MEQLQHRTDVRMAMIAMGVSRDRPAAPAEIAKHCKVLKTGVEVSTVLSQLHVEGKVDRAGRPRDFRYWLKEKPKPDVAALDRAIAGIGGPATSEPTKVVQQMDDGEGTPPPPPQKPRVANLQAKPKSQAQAQAKPAPVQEKAPPAPVSMESAPAVVSEVRVSAAGIVLIARWGDGAIVRVAVPPEILAPLMRCGAWGCGGIGDVA